MICFHHNDADGRCAAAIVYKAYRFCRFVEMNYDKPVPFELIDLDEEIIIVDFSFKPDDMEKLVNITGEIVWIDHHKTILDHPFNKPAIAGIREINYSGCYYTWQYFFPELPVPWAVELISDYDTWTLALPDSKAMRFGLGLYPHGPKEHIWESLLTGKWPEVNLAISQLIDDGRIVLKFINQFGGEYIKSYGFEIADFEGFRCIAQGVYTFGSTFFGPLIDEYDICISFEWTGQNWIVGLYSVKTDVSTIAKKYGGGGHKGAAGFICDELPFTKS